MCVVFFQFFFYEGRFGEDRDNRSTRVRVENPKAKADSHRKTDLKYMIISKKKTKKTSDAQAASGSAPHSSFSRFNLESLTKFIGPAAKRAVQQER